MAAYYNEIDPFAASWLEALIWDDQIAYGVVDRRSIEDVTPDDLKGFDQHHFFAGIGVWSRALRLVGWPDDRPIWTGSCPCQPFSDAGHGGGFADKRHLWPVWFRLIGECRPATIIGEQVASRAGLGWFDLVSADLEGAGYAVGAADLCAAGVGAPHIRQRLYWVGHAGSARAGGHAGAAAGAVRSCPSEGHTDRQHTAYGAESPGPVGHSEGQQCDGAGRPRGGLGGSPDPGSLVNAAGEQAWVPGRPRESGGAVADADGGDASAEWEQRGGQHGQQPADGEPSGAVAHDHGERQPQRAQPDSDTETGRSAPRRADLGGRGEPGGAVAHGGSTRLEVIGEQHARGGLPATERGGEAVLLGHPTSERQCANQLGCDSGAGQQLAGSRARSDRGNPSEAGFWSDPDWVPCRDGKRRPVEPGTFPLAHGVAGRVGKLRGYGNAIVLPLAATFLEAVTGCL